MKICGLITLQKYMDNELDIKNLAVFNKHLKSCAECQKNLELLKKEEEFLNNISQEKLSADFTNNVMKLVQNTQIQKKPGMVSQIILSVMLISLIITVYTIMPDYNLKIMTDIFTDFLIFILKMAKIFFSSALNNSFAQTFINPLFLILKKNIFSIALRVTVIESAIILLAVSFWTLNRIKPSRIGSRGAFDLPIEKK